MSLAHSGRNRPHVVTATRSTATPLRHLEPAETVVVEPRRPTKSSATATRWCRHRQTRPSRRPPPCPACRPAAPPPASAHPAADEMTTPATAPRSNGCPSSITVISHGSIARSCCSLSPALSAPARPSPSAPPSPRLDPPATPYLPARPHRRRARHLTTTSWPRSAGSPSFHNAALAPQAADALAAEHAERGRTPVVVHRHYRPHD